MIPQSAATVLRVSDLPAALAHYVSVFGFEEDFRFGDYAGLKMGAIALHLTGSNLAPKPIGSGVVYIFCDEVDDYCATLKARGALIQSPPQDQPYGMREFTVADPDGNHLVFGRHRPGDPSRGSR